jgi:hypothetical protein
VIADLRIENGRSGRVPVLTLLTDNGDAEVWASPFDLKTQLAKVEPKAGDSSNWSSSNSGTPVSPPQ